MAQMKSLIHNTKDHSLKLGSQPEPVPSPSQYLIRVQAIGITKDELQWQEPNTLPDPNPGYDVAGIVVAAPPKDAKFSKGDRVYAMTGPERTANARELTTIDESEITTMPKNLSFEDAAAVPMSAMTAREALFDKGCFANKADSPENEYLSLLVIGASGAVGIWAVQLAKWAGIGRVVGVCGTNNVDFVRNLGADEVIDHRKTSLKEWASTHGEEGDFDLVLDGVGGSTLSEAWALVKKGGQLISIVQPVDNTKPKEGVNDGVKGSFFIVSPRGNLLAEITELIEQKSVRPVVDSIHELNDFQAAFDRVESGRARGKVILQIAAQ